MDATSGLLHVVQTAHDAARDLATLKGAQRSAALQRMAKALVAQQDQILEANTLDLETSREMAVPDLILDWLRLTPERLHCTVQIFQRLAEMPDPLQQWMNLPYPVTPEQTYGRLMPLGVIALVYESFPDLGAIAAAMCLRTGNSLVLRGSPEASHSNQAIADILQGALTAAGMPPGTLSLLPGDRGASIRECITQAGQIDLVIPYGRTSLVQQVEKQATVPVLRTCLGNCYLYWAPSGSLDMARWMILESHRSDPDPVNAIEKVLIHRQHDPTLLQSLWHSLREEGMQLRGDESLVAEFPDLVMAEPDDWGRPYLNKTIAFRVVDSASEAIDWMNRFSSGHADGLITESYAESQQFANALRSAALFINTSLRFSRDPRQGGPVVLGMSNQFGHARGFITLQSLMAINQVIQGPGGRSSTHTPLDWATKGRAD